HVGLHCSTLFCSIYPTPTDSYPLSLHDALPILLHVVDPAVVVGRMAIAVRPGGWVVAQEPITTAGRIGGQPLSMLDAPHPDVGRSEEHTSELQSLRHLVCRLLLEKKKTPSRFEHAPMRSPDPASERTAKQLRFQACPSAIPVRRSYARTHTRVFRPPCRRHSAPQP